MFVLCILEVLIDSRRGVLLALDATGIYWLAHLVCWRSRDLELLVNVLGILELHISSVTGSCTDFTLTLGRWRVDLISRDLFCAVFER